MSQQIPGVSVNIAEYLAGKASGATQVIKLNGKFHYTEKRFDAKTGKPEPVFVSIDRDQIVKAKEDLVQQIVTLDALIKDMDEAKELLQPAA